MQYHYSWYNRSMLDHANALEIGEPTNPFKLGCTFLFWSFLFWVFPQSWSFIGSHNADPFYLFADPAADPNAMMMNGCLPPSISSYSSPADMLCVVCLSVPPSLSGKAWNSAPNNPNADTADWKCISLIKHWLVSWVARCLAGLVVCRGLAEAGAKKEASGH